MGRRRVTAPAFWACPFCGRDATPGHACTATRASVPLLVSGALPETRRTSHAAAVSRVDRDSQREAVFTAIRRAGPHGCTDEELQTLLGLDGNSVRPRRWELQKLDRILVCRDELGRAVRRRTHTHHWAVVWVAAPEEISSLRKQ